MAKSDIIEFFNGYAKDWDAEMIIHPDIVKKIFDESNIYDGLSILDVACGTGVLFPFYIERNVESITAIDISPKMAKIAESKVAGQPITVICGDVETEVFNKKFDVIMLYNAFPHFMDPNNLIKVLSGNLNKNGRITIAHGMSREKIDHHHEGTSSKVSCGLMHEDELARIMEPYLNVDVKISDDKMYMVSGTLK